MVRTARRVTMTPVTSAVIARTAASRVPAHAAHSGMSSIILVSQRSHQLAWVYPSPYTGFSIRSRGRFRGSGGLDVRPACRGDGRAPRASDAGLFDDEGVKPLDVAGQVDLSVLFGYLGLVGRHVQCEVAQVQVVVVGGLLHPLRERGGGGDGACGALVGGGHVGEPGVDTDDGGERGTADLGAAAGAGGHSFPPFLQTLQSWVRPQSQVMT